MNRRLRTRWARKRLVIAAATALVLGAAATVYLLTREPAPVEGDRCAFSSNTDYEAIVGQRLSEYDHDALTASGMEGAADAATLAGNIEERSYIPLFMMQSCTIPGDLRSIRNGIQEVVDDPESNSPGLPAGSADLEVGWFDDLGADGLVTGWGLIGLIGSGDPFWGSDVSTAAAEDASQIQRLLGTGLANSTNPDRQTLLAEGNYTELTLGPEYFLDDQFTAAILATGTAPVTLVKYDGPRWNGESLHGSGFYRGDSGEWEVEAVGPTVHGWAVLAPLLRFGNYHEDFLTPVATAIIEFDREHRGVWEVEGHDQASFDIAADAGDPVAPVLEALSRNPIATEAVFETTGDERVAALLNG